MTASITCTPPGAVHSEFKTLVGVPIQTAGAPDRTAFVEVFPPFAAGLRDLEGFDHPILLTHLHGVREERLEVVPFLDTESHGVFATRAPSRPNRMGLSIVRLLSVDGLQLHFTGNDMIDGTPVLDIKPYVPAFDVRQAERVGGFCEAPAPRVEHDLRRPHALTVAAQRAHGTKR